MGHARVMIQIASERSFPPRANMMMSYSLIKRLSLSRSPIWVTYGSAANPAFIVPLHNHTPIIRISIRLANQLKISSQRTVNVHFDPVTRCLRFGPILGILMNEDIEGREAQQFGTMTRFLEECAQRCNTLGVCMTVVAPDRINIHTKSLKGWILDNKQWVMNESPLPDVLYNRITSRKLEKKVELREKIATLQRSYGIPIFNETFLNKQEVHDMLYQDIAMRRILPETYLYQPSRLKSMLEKYRTVYLKPCNGSLGQGIIRITRHEKQFICQYSEVTGTVTRVCSGLKELARQLARKTINSQYIIQQGLYLVTWDSRPVDFRVLVQKDRRGKWSVTSSVARIANSQHIVSNLARGGTIRKASEVLAGIQINNKPTLSHIRDTALTIAHTFEQLVQGHFAELGIDLVLDRQGRLWLIELNSKPSKTDDTITTPSLTIRPSVNRLIDYTLFITGWFQRFKQNRTSLQPKGSRRKTR